MANEITLKSGKRLSPNCGFIGLNQKFQVSEGYDDVWVADYIDEEMNNYLTPEERLEVCELMVQRWTDYKNQVQGELSYAKRFGVNEGNEMQR